MGIVRLLQVLYVRHRQGLQCSAHTTDAITRVNDHRYRLQCKAARQRYQRCEFANECRKSMLSKTEVADAILLIAEGKTANGKLYRNDVETEAAQLLNDMAERFDSRVE